MVERARATLQDRLVKELRLAGIIDLEHRTFKWTHHQRLRHGSRVAEMQNLSDLTSRPML
jgi:hypothetical protein